MAHALPQAEGRPLLIAGCGDSGRRLARLWQANGGGPVTGLVRSADSAARLSALGIQAWRCDLDAPAGPPPRLEPRAVLVWLAPPPREGRTDPRLAGGLRWLLGGGHPEALVYASTTGVYPGTVEGETDETVAPAPETDRGRRRLDAEETALSLGQAHDLRVVRLRIAGIYGPGRLPVARLKAGQALSPALAARPGNRIHVEDLAAALFLAALRGEDGAVYNVADQAPAAFGDYLDACADALGLPRLPRSEQAGPDPAEGFLRGQRRIDAARLRHELGLVLRYPDYRAGIAASLDDQAF